MNFSPAGLKLLMIIIQMWVFYRYPRKNFWDEFVENLKAILSKIKNRNKQIIIPGDFNYDLLKYEYNEYINMNFLIHCVQIFCNHV